jgi:hypothetical protein
VQDSLSYVEFVQDSLSYAEILFSITISPQSAQVMSHTAQYLVYFNLPSVQRIVHQPPLRTTLSSTQLFCGTPCITCSLHSPYLRSSAHISSSTLLKFHTSNVVRIDLFISILSVIFMNIVHLAHSSKVTYCTLMNSDLQGKGR